MERQSHTSAMRFLLSALCFAWFAISMAGPKCIERSQADSMSRRQIIYNNRVCPFNTLAHYFCTKITGKTSFRGLTAEQVILSWSLYADEWQHVDMIKIKQKEVKEKLGIKTQLARFTDFFDSRGLYRLHGGDYPDIDEKIGLILWLNEGTLIQPIPSDVPRLSTTEIDAEILYNRIPFTTILFASCLTIVVILLIHAFGVRFTRCPDGCQPHISQRNYQRIGTIIQSQIFLLTFLLLFAIALRWYISGALPLSNGFETMQFVALVSLLVGSFRFRNMQFCISGLTIAGFTLLVAHLAEMNPQITPLMPVLHSPWLSSHVSLIMISYALFAFTAVRPSHTLLLLATMFLAVGIFLGAIWANQSWGTYWSWDPKESWALISLIVYGIALHRESLPFLRNANHYAWYVRLAFLTILMTYFGVNYLLGGMHSYANS